MGGSTSDISSFSSRAGSPTAKPLAGMGDVVRLPSNVAPGDRVEVPLRLTAPPRPGAYEIDFHVVQALDGEHGVVGPDGLKFPMRVD